jgi:hypothetical protein
MKIHLFHKWQNLNYQSLKNTDDDNKCFRLIQRCSKCHKIRKVPLSQNISYELLNKPTNDENWINF